jgi:pilus assembly protein CpaB
MSRMRGFLVLAVALMAGAVLAFGTYNYVQARPADRGGAAAVPTRPVVVAATDLNLGAELRPEDVKVIEWPSATVPAGAIGDPKEVIGRGVVAPLVQHEVILPLKLASKEAGAGLPPIIPPGLRAVSVRVNEVIGVAGYVVPGTRVDVLTTINPAVGGPQQGQITSKVILTDVQVLAAGTKIETTEKDQKPVPVSVVTLLVNPDESERLTLAATEGKIQLALRNPLDRSAPQTRGVRPAALLGTEPAARQVPTRRQAAAQTAVVAVPSGPPGVTVEIIRGDKRAHEVVRQEH